MTLAVFHGRFILEPWHKAHASKCVAEWKVACRHCRLNRSGKEMIVATKLPCTFPAHVAGMACANEQYLQVREALAAKHGALSFVDCCPLDPVQLSDSSQLFREM